jgi:hypothetical protein
VIGRDALSPQEIASFDFIEKIWVRFAEIAATGRGAKRVLISLEKMGSFRQNRNSDRIRLVAIRRRRSAGPDDPVKPLPSSYGVPALSRGPSASARDTQSGMLTITLR